MTDAKTVLAEQTLHASGDSLMEIADVEAQSERRRDALERAEVRAEALERRWERATAHVNLGPGPVCGCMVCADIRAALAGKEKP